MTKEPAMFTDHCTIKGYKMNCGGAKEYIEDVLKLPTYVKEKGQLAPFEATPRIFDVS